MTDQPKTIEEHVEQFEPKFGPVGLGPGGVDLGPYAAGMNRYPKGEGCWIHYGDAPRLMNTYATERTEPLRLALERARRDIRPNSFVSYTTIATYISAALAAEEEARKS